MVYPSGPTAPRSAPEITAPDPEPAFQASAAIAFTPALSRGVKDEKIVAFHVALDPYISQARSASAATTRDRSAANAATSANGSEPSTTPTTDGTAPKRRARNRSCARAPRLPATAMTPRTTPSAANGTPKRSAKNRFENGRKLPAPSPNTNSTARKRASRP